MKFALLLILGWLLKSSIAVAGLPAAGIGELHSALIIQPFVHSVGQLSHTSVHGGVPRQNKLLIILHGCGQTAEDMVIGTQAQTFADQTGWTLIFPRVPSGSNPLNCWNWFLPQNQTPWTGQLFWLKQQLELIRVDLHMPRAQLYVAGLSAGGAMAAGLLACFPKDFAGGVIHSAPTYAAAQSAAEALLILKQGAGYASHAARTCKPEKFNKSIMIIFGTADQVVHRSHIDWLISDFLADARPAPPQHQCAMTHTLRPAGQSVQDVGQGSCYDVQDFYRVQLASANRRGSRQLRGRVVLVPDLGHGWPVNQDSPTQPLPPYFSSQGPSSMKLLFDFFQEAAHR